MTPVRYFTGCLRSGHIPYTVGGRNEKIVKIAVFSSKSPLLDNFHTPVKGAM